MKKTLGGGSRADNNPFGVILNVAKEKHVQEMLGFQRKYATQNSDKPLQLQ